MRNRSYRKFWKLEIFSLLIAIGRFCVFDFYFSSEEKVAPTETKEMTTNTEKKKKKDRVEEEIEIEKKKAKKQKKNKERVPIG